MVNAIEYPQVESMMHFEQGQIEVLKLSIAERCYICWSERCWVLKLVSSGSLIIGYQLHPHDDLMIPNGNTVMEPGSTVLIVAKPGSVHQVIDFVKAVNNFIRLHFLFSNCFYCSCVLHLKVGGSAQLKKSTQVTPSQGGDSG